MDKLVDATMLIVGLGNILRRDDGVGIKILSHIKNLDAEIINGETYGFALIDKIAEYDEAIIIDAVNMGKPAGTCKMFVPKDIKCHPRADRDPETKMSTHKFGLVDILALIKSLEIKTKIHIIGIQPKDISFGEGLTDKVQEAMPKVVQLIRKISYA
jgi:hydrogenase maturation protease